MRLPRPSAIAWALCLVGALAEGAVAARSAASLRQDFLARFARAYFPGRSGQVFLVPREGNVITTRDAAYAYMHGSPWRYDTRIPFLLWGRAFVRSGTYAEPVTQQDMAPTLASLLGVSMPGTSSGRSQSAILKPANQRPRLVVLLVLDGMRVDYFDRHAAVLPVLSRMRAQGAWFPNARLNQLPSITSVGHATLATGADARVHGIVANSTFDEVRGQAADLYAGLSPRNLMALTLADVWNARTEGRAVIIGQGTTPRAALPLAGHGGCLLNARPVIEIHYNEKSGAWDTGAECYRRPDYLQERNARELWDGTDGLWMGHDISGASAVRASALFSRFETSALKLMIEHEPLGEDDVADLVMVNLKTPDYVGHRYGPDSPELREALSALDRDLGGAVAALDAKIGADRYVLAVSADHGMPPEPDARLGGRRRIYTDEIVALLHARFDPEQKKLVQQYEPENSQLAIDRRRLRELGLDLNALRTYLEQQPFVFAAYTEDEVARAAAR